MEVGLVGHGMEPWSARGRRGAGSGLVVNTIRSPGGCVGPPAGAASVLVGPMGLDNTCGASEPFPISEAGVQVGAGEVLGRIRTRTTQGTKQSGADQGRHIVDLETENPRRLFGREPSGAVPEVEELALFGVHGRQIRWSGG